MAEPVAALICMLGVLTRELSLSGQWSAGLEYSPKSWTCRSNDLQACKEYSSESLACRSNDLHAWSISWRSTNQKAEPVAAMICRLGRSTHQRAEPVAAMICRLGVLTRKLRLSQQWSAGLEYSPESWACRSNDLQAWSTHQRAEPVAAMIYRFGVLTRELSLSRQWSAG